MLLHDCLRSLLAFLLLKLRSRVQILQKAIAGAALQRQIADHNLHLPVTLSLYKMGAQGMDAIRRAINLTNIEHAVPIHIEGSTWLQALDNL